MCSFITVNSTYHPGKYLFPIVTGKSLVFHFASKATTGQSSVCPIAESTAEVWPVIVNGEVACS